MIIWITIATLLGIVALCAAHVSSMSMWTPPGKTEKLGRLEGMLRDWRALFK